MVEFKSGNKNNNLWSYYFYIYYFHITYGNGGV